MKHAAHRATARKGARIGRFVSPPSASGSQVDTGVDDALAAKLNEVAPPTRRSIRLAAKAEARRAHLVTGSALTVLVGAAASSLVMSQARNDASIPLAISTGNAVVSSAGSLDSTMYGRNTVSRSEARRNLSDVSQTNEGSWQLGDEGLDAGQMSRSLANNPAVARLMDVNQDVIPSGFNPNHATGDSGNAYEFSQCTWWAYTRRHQLGLPVGSHLGNGRDWAASAKALGYWVDDTPRNVGDVIVFQAGQEGSDAFYGHVAIVEKINADGSIVTSECGAVMNGKTYSRTLTNVHALQYIHY
ncbi:CHAP domain-containing protein [uncultured Bifidobacterium sp.]|uniref:CHAP domain-containing protein n=1 Tax=uncultured Bifidobacterium sp. TaxID=165187 RepID=UPI00344DE35E